MHPFHIFKSVSATVAQDLFKENGCIDKAAKIACRHLVMYERESITRVLKTCVFKSHSIISLFSRQTGQFRAQILDLQLEVLNRLH
jgi:hypothetical protein